MRFDRPARKQRGKSTPLAEMWIPKSFVDRLESLRPGLRHEDDRIRGGITRLAYRASCGGKPHALDPEFIVLHHRVVDREIGRSREGDTGLVRLRAANDRLQLFDLLASEKLANGVAGGYRLRRDVETALDALADAEPDPPPSPMLDSRGRRRRKPPKPLASQTSSGSTCAAEWPEAFTGRTPVDRDALRALSDMARAAYASGVLPDGSRIDDRQRQFCRLVARSVGAILEVSNTDIAKLGPGVMHHRYRQHEYGRFYTVAGPSLQLAPRIVRDAALRGCWDYDVRNCHPTLAAQVASDLDVNVPALARYADPATTETVLKHLMATCDAPRSVVKEALLAVINGGAAMPVDGKPIAEQRAVVRALGVERAGWFATDKFVADLIEDSARLRKAIARSWPDRHGGRLRNRAGLLFELDETLEQRSMQRLTKAQSMARDRARDAQRRKALAFILQGAESAVLSAVIARDPGDVVLLQHDGFVSLRRIAADALSGVVEVASGFRGLRFKEAEITFGASEFCISVRESGEGAQVAEIAGETACGGGAEVDDCEG